MTTVVRCHLEREKISNKIVVYLQEATEVPGRPGKREKGSYKNAENIQVGQVRKRKLQEC
jgi:hypothetical protein